MKKIYEHIFERHRLKQLNEARADDEITIPLNAPFNNNFPWQRPTSSSPIPPNLPIPSLPPANPDETISPANPRPGNPLRGEEDLGTFNAPHENTPNGVWIYDPKTGNWHYKFKIKSPFGPNGYWWGESANPFNQGRNEPPWGAWCWDPEIGWYRWGVPLPPRPSTPATPVTPRRPIIPHWSRPDAPRGPRY